MSILQATELKKYYGTEPNITRALDGVTLSIEKGEFVAIVGTSGSGKSTLLNMIGGLDVPTSGQVVVDGKELSKLKDEELTVFRRRKIGFIFQNYNLVPVLNVYENIVLPVELDGNKVDKKFMKEVVQMLGLEDKLNNMPNNLSGGQQQRVAIARALVTGPSIICMDEPLSNLDAKLRVQLRNELKKMQRDFGITTIYVTHDQEEALTLSDRIAVFNKGYIEQIGTPNEIYNHSKTEFVCNFIGDINRLEETICGEMKLPETRHHFVRLERLRVNRPKDEGELQMQGTIESREYYGLYIKYYIRVDGQILKAIEKNDGINIYEPGETVTVGIHPADVMSYDVPAEA